MPNFQDWAALTPQYGDVAVTLSQLAMKYGLTERSTLSDVFRALQAWTAPQSYNESADDLPQAIQQKVWNCVSLTRLLVLMHAMLTNQHPTFLVGVREQRVETRKLSQAGVRANIHSLLPNVVRPDVPAESRYTFSGHTWVTIGGTDYDLLMGTTGAAATATFSVNVQKNADGAFACMLTPPVAPPAAARPLVAAGPGMAGMAGRPGGVGAAAPRPAAAPPLAPGGPVQYWLRGTGGRVGSLPAFELVRV